MLPPQRPIVAAPYFGTGPQSEPYRRLARVLEYTAAQQCARWDIRVQRLTPPVYQSSLGNPSHVWNTQKLDWWRQVVHGTQDGQAILLMDADMMILRPLDDVWTHDFDLAYTNRPTGRLPFNGGVVGLRVSERTKRFIDQWWETNVRFLQDAVAHRPWRAKYAGINQASFGYVLEKVDHGCALLQLPCLEWNCENTTWASFDPAVTRIVHLKSGLRRALFSTSTSREHQRLIAIWRALEQQMTDCAVKAAS